MERPDNIGIITQVAELYCKSGKSQREIADELRISQASVSGYVKKAEALGMIKRVFSLLPELSLRDELLRKFNLREAVVIDIGETEDYDFIFRQLGIQGAIYLDSILRDGMTLAVGGGELLHLLAQELPQRARDIDIIPSEKELFLDPIDYITADGVCRLIAERCERKATVWELPYFYAKYFQRYASFALEEHVPNLGGMDEIKNVDVYLNTIGAVIPIRASFTGRLFRRAKERANEIGKEISIQQVCSKLDELGVKGELSDVPFNAAGEKIEGNEWLKHLNRLSFPIVDLEDLRTMSARHNKYVIVFGGGRDKVEALLAALRGGLLNVLITDTVAAEGLLSKASQSKKEGCSETRNA